MSDIRVDVSTLPSSVVMEGRPFERQPVVKVGPTDPNYPNSKGYGGRIVYAIVVAKDGLAPPGKLTSSFDMPEIAVKRLIHATATTDASGEARFDKLAFQAGGNAGSYRIEFWCEGKGSDPDAAVLVNVTSSIARVQVRGARDIQTQF